VIGVLYFNLKNVIIRLLIVINYFLFIGPSVWPKFFPQAGGLLQSPVNIETSKSTNDMTLNCKPLYWNYSPEICTKIINTGYGWKVDATGGEGSGIFQYSYYSHIFLSH